MKGKLLLCVLLCAGCATKNSIEMGKIAAGAYKDYISQERSSELLSVRAPEGQTITLSISGAEEIVVRTQTTPLSVLNSQDDSLRTIVDGAARIATVAGAAIVGRDMVEAIKPAAPVIVPQQVIHPQIVPVPTQVIR